MAKTHKLSTTWNVTGGTLKIEVSASLPPVTDGVDGAFVRKFDRSINLASIFGEGYTALNEAGSGAVEFGAFTALRNSTGSCDTIDEAEQAIDRRIAAWESGEWGAEREQSAIPFTANALIAKAVAKATNGAQPADVAAEKLCAMAQATCDANSFGEFASLEPAERAKIRKAVVDQIKKSKPAIAAALAQLEAERDEAAAAKKREAAQKALAAAGAVEEVGL